LDDRNFDPPQMEPSATVTTRRRGHVPAVNAEPVAKPGDVLISRFRLQRIIGRGGMGVVFAANDLQMQGEPLLAIKLLNEDMRDFPIAAMALERECRKVRMLAHDAIVRVFEFYRAGDQTFITMELLDGESLDVVIKRFPQGLPREDAWPIIQATGDALGYAHRQSPPFVHSDFKPSNVFVTRTDRVKVLDFGVARAVRTPDMATAHNLSIFDPSAYGALTPAYASSEMLAGLASDPSDDVYALACVAYETLCGKHPYQRRPADQARALRLKLAPIPGLGHRANRALAHGLAIDRGDRTPSVAQFLAELGDAPRSAASRRQGQQRRKAGTIAAGIALLGLAIWGGVSLRHSTRTSPTESLAPAVRASPARTAGSAAAAAATTPNVGAPVDAARAIALLQQLGADTSALKAGTAYPPAGIRQLIESEPRKATLGSTPEQMQSALALCRQHSADCEASWYADEKLRTVTLNPFEMDTAPVTVRDFRRFADSTPYRTQAETAGFAYAVVGENLQRVSGGSWRNAIKQFAIEDDQPVVGVTFNDAQAYCRYRRERLPTEDEWEYAARGPARHVFPWGENPAPAARGRATPPRAGDGPAEGIGDRYRGLSGSVWQWVDTTAPDGTRLLKGGSWLDTNPANRRAAVQRMEQSDRADADSGFRCARSLAAWPDADFWLARLVP
jgi:formylglycine-generating enzyme required for sulfatase activity